jgi:hypothetical protein
MTTVGSGFPVCRRASARRELAARPMAGTFVLRAGFERVRDYAGRKAGGRAEALAPQGL